MQAIQRVSTAAALPNWRAIGSLWILSASLCAAAFVLLVATAFSDAVVRVAGGETVDVAQFLGQFAYPSIPLLLVGALIAARSHAAATLVGLSGTALYLLLWVTIAF